MGEAPGQPGRAPPCRDGARAGADSRDRWARRALRALAALLRALGGVGARRGVRALGMPGGGGAARARRVLAAAGDGRWRRGSALCAGSAGAVGAAHAHKEPGAVAAPRGTALRCGAVEERLQLTGRGRAPGVGAGALGSRNLSNALSVQRACAAQRSGVAHAGALSPSTPPQPRAPRLGPHGAPTKLSRPPGTAAPNPPPGSRSWVTTRSPPAEPDGVGKAVDGGEKPRRLLPGRRSRGRARPGRLPRFPRELHRKLGTVGALGMRVVQSYAPSAAADAPGRQRRGAARARARARARGRTRCWGQTEAFVLCSRRARRRAARGATGAAPPRARRPRRRGASSRSRASLHGRARARQGARGVRGAACPISTG